MGLTVLVAGEVAGVGHRLRLTDKVVGAGIANRRGAHIYQSIELVDVAIARLSMLRERIQVSHEVWVHTWHGEL